MHNLFPRCFGKERHFLTDEIHALFAHTEVKAFPTYSLLTEKEAYPYLLFVEVGLLREFSVIDQQQGDTLTHHLVESGDFCCGVRHFLPIYAVPSEIEVLERATVWCIKKEELEMLGLTFPSLQMLTQFTLANCLQGYDACTNILKQLA